MIPRPRTIRTNSREVEPGDVFIAIRGEKFDGHDYVADALGRGAAKCIVEEDIPGAKIPRDGRDKLEFVPDTRAELSRLCYEAFGRPSDKLKVIGITGTNGKTTISYLMDKIFTDLGKRTGMLGTIEYKIGDKIKPADRTTPDAFSLQSMLSEMVEGGITHAVMEVSSHALHQKRAGHVFYDAAIFTNLTPEHLDYHKDMQEYFEAKAMIFDNLKETGVGVINLDDEFGKKLMEAKKRCAISFSVDKKADVYAKDITTSVSGSKFTIVTPIGEMRIKTGLIGKHNISNILAAAAAGCALKVGLESLAASINHFRAPRGRLERVDEGQAFSVFVDYAHTKDALYNVLSALKPFAEKKIITVFGCGGDRDKTKRPEMGKVAVRYSDHVVITNDNPRTEKPENIVGDIVAGISGAKNYEVECDRRKAIETALKLARRGDIVLIAGKGHEAEQIIGAERHVFDDRIVAQTILKAIAK